MPDPSPSTWLVWDERFREHEAPLGHPERAERLTAVRRGIDAAAERGLHLRDVPARTTSDAVLALGHTPEHVDLVARASAAGLHLDGDTYTSRASDATARLAVGSAIALCEAVLGAQGPTTGFAAVRPPGHHAERDSAMGFCPYANVALAALDLKARGLVDRVAIVDWDVHHGNGTQALLWERADLLYVSMHQYPLYPGTGALDDLGAGDGEGWTVNLPVPAFTGDGDAVALFERVVVPVLEAANPDLIVISAGFDAHRLDPLASLQLSGDGYGWLTERLLRLGRPVAAVLEGGYHPVGLAEGVGAMLNGFAGRFPEGDPPPGGRVAQLLGDALVERLSPHWPSLA
jgi:acetoin utilization deacetylase AcuC-like enzyme